MDINSPLSATPQWLRIPQAVQLYGIGRSTLYELIASGKIKSSVIRKERSKKKTGRNHGARLISAASLDAFISGFATGGEEVKPAKKGGKR